MPDEASTAADSRSTAGFNIPSHALPSAGQQSCVSSGVTRLKGQFFASEAPMSPQFIDSSFEEVCTRTPSSYKHAGRGSSIPMPAKSSESNQSCQDHLLPEMMTFAHNCRFPCCNDIDCLLCIHSRERQCTQHLKQKYLVGDRIRAKCNAPVAIRVPWHNLPLETDNLSRNTRYHVQLRLLDGAKYDEAMKANPAPCLPLPTIDACCLPTTGMKQALPGEVYPASKMCVADEKIILPVEDDMASLEDVVLTASSDEVLSSFRNDFRLAAFLIDAQGAPVPGAPYIVSSGFTVITRRPKNTYKMDIPLNTETISKLQHMGKATVEKLGDLEAAAAKVNTPFTLPPGVGSKITNIEQFQQLANACDEDNALKTKVIQVLKFSHDKWAEAVAHARQSIKVDFRPRMWMDMDLGVAIAVKCRQGTPMLEEIEGILELHADGSYDIRDMIRQDDISNPVTVAVSHKLLARAVAAWKLPGHPGWGILDESGSGQTKQASEADVPHGHSLKSPPLDRPPSTSNNSKGPVQPSRSTCGTRPPSQSGAPLSTPSGTAPSPTIVSNGTPPDVPPPAFENPPPQQHAPSAQECGNHHSIISARDMQAGGKFHPPRPNSPQSARLQPFLNHQGSINSTNFNFPAELPSSPSPSSNVPPHPHPKPSIPSIPSLPMKFGPPKTLPAVGIYSNSDGYSHPSDSYHPSNSCTPEDTMDNSNPHPTPAERPLAPHRQQLHMNPPNQPANLTRFTAAQRKLHRQSAPPSSHAPAPRANRPGFHASPAHPHPHPHPPQLTPHNTQLATQGGSGCTPVVDPLSEIPLPDLLTHIVHRLQDPCDADALHMDRPDLRDMALHLLHFIAADSQSDGSPPGFPTHPRMQHQMQQQAPKLLPPITTTPPILSDPPNNLPHRFPRGPKPSKPWAPNHTNPSFGPTPRGPPRGAPHPAPPPALPATSHQSSGTEHPPSPSPHLSSIPSPFQASLPHCANNPPPSANPSALAAINSFAQDPPSIQSRTKGPAANPNLRPSSRHNPRGAQPTHPLTQHVHVDPYTGVSSRAGTGAPATPSSSGAPPQARPGCAPPPCASTEVPEVPASGPVQTLPPARPSSGAAPRTCSSGAGPVADTSAGCSNPNAGAMAASGAQQPGVGSVGNYPDFAAELAPHGLTGGVDQFGPVDFNRSEQDLMAMMWGGKQGGKPPGRRERIIEAILAGLGGTDNLSYDDASGEFDMNLPPFQHAGMQYGGGFAQGGAPGVAGDFRKRALPDEMWAEQQGGPMKRSRGGLYGPSPSPQPLVQPQPQPGFWGDCENVDILGDLGGPEGVDCGREPQQYYDVPDGMSRGYSPGGYPPHHHPQATLPMQGMGRQGMGMGPQGAYPQGMNPQDIGPQGMNSQGMDMRVASRGGTPSDCRFMGDEALPFWPEVDEGDMQPGRYDAKGGYFNGGLGNAQGV